MGLLDRTQYLCLNARDLLVASVTTVAMRALTISPIELDSRIEVCQGSVIYDLALAPSHLSGGLGYGEGGRGTARASFPSGTGHGTCGGAPCSVGTGGTRLSSLLCTK